MVLVSKKDGGVRFCIDYQKLNTVTKLDDFLLPGIDDLLAEAKFFTMLYSDSGYWQVPVNCPRSKKTAFTVYLGLYKFKNMTFGLTNAPATFQRLMETQLDGLTHDGCHVYLNDVPIFG